MTLNDGNYTDKDFVALQARLRGLMQSIFPEWPVNDDANYGNRLLDMMAFVGDILNFYNDSNLQEASVSTAQLLQTLLDHAFGLDVVLPLQEAATVPETFSIDTPRAVDTVIPAGTVITTSGEEIIAFQSLSDVTLLAGEVEVNVTLENSEIITETLYPTGAAFWSAYLGQVEFLRIVSVVDESGNAWTQEDTLVQSGSTDRHFTVIVNAAGRGRLRFGNGILGARPTTPLTVRYAVGGGSVGNVVEHTLRTIQDSILDNNGQAVPFSVDNTVAASGGSDRISVEEARALIPASFRTQKRSVGEGDYAANALLVPGVARAIEISSDQDSAMEDGLVHVRVVPNGGGDPSQALLDSVEDQLTTTFPHSTGVTLGVFGALYKAVDVVAKVYRKAGETMADTGESIRSDLVAFFALTRPSSDGETEPNDNVRFGGQYINAEGVPDPYLAYSDVYNVIRDNETARKLGAVTLNGNNADVFLLFGEFPILGSVTFIDGDTGQIF